MILDALRYLACAAMVGLLLVVIGICTGGNPMGKDDE